MNRREMIRRSAAALMAGGMIGAEALGRRLSAATGTAPAIVGLGSHGLEPEDLRALRSIGVEHVRFTLYWHHWERDEPYRVHTRRRIDAAVDEGFRLLVVVHGEEPSWGGWSRRYALYDRFATFMNRRAREMPGVEAWELFNEGEGHMTTLFGAGRAERDLVADGADCAFLHRKAYQAIKDANPDAGVVAMSLTPDDHGFKKGFFEAGASADVLNVHLYGWPMAESLRRGAMEFDALLARHDQTGRPVWCTEFGISREMLPLPRRLPGLWEDTQAVQWREFVTANDAAGYFPRVYGYQLKTDEAGVYGTKETHGIIRPDGSLRPAAEWLRDRLS